MATLVVRETCSPSFPQPGWSLLRRSPENWGARDGITCMTYLLLLSSLTPTHFHAFFSPLVNLHLGVGNQLVIHRTPRSYKADDLAEYPSVTCVHTNGLFGVTCVAKTYETIGVWRYVYRQAQREVD